jgi:outer membrane protein assembly factor BamB
MSHPLPGARGGLGGLIACAALFTAAEAPANDNPVYVDDSPRAWELLRQARAQAPDNVGEAVRLYQELLDDYALRLVPARESTPDLFGAVRAAVLGDLAADDRLRERYRSIETAEAQRLLREGRLERLALTRSMTEAGLDALLVLAQVEIEAGRFHAALSRLDEASSHPDLAGSRGAHCWFMIGAAAHYRGDGDRAAEALEALGELGSDADDLPQQLRRIIAGGLLPPAPRGVSPLDPTQASDFTELVAQPIWSLPLVEEEAASASAAEVDPGDARLPGLRARTPGDLTAAPTATGSAIFVNEGRTVHGVDRFTGRPLWRPFIDPSVASSGDRVGQQVADLNIVSVEGDLMVTMTGHALAGGGVAERQIVCLDARTGALRWSVRIGGLGGSGEFEGLVPHGAAVIAEGGVYLLARKISRQILTSCYAIALDLSDGSLRWARHVASSGGIRQRHSRPHSTLLYHEGDLVIATPIGAVARIDASTGQTRWLRRYNPPLNPYLPEERGPWELSGPVVIQEGVVAIRPDLQAIVRLDWRTGDELESVSAVGRDAWDGPRYLLGDDETVYGVGEGIRAFAAGALRHPLWMFPPREQAARLELVGRVQVADAGLLVPTTEGIYLLDRATGLVVHHLPADSWGNPLGAGPQLLVASDDALDAYMPFGRAEEMLRRQMIAAPGATGPALALMRLGLQARNLDLALQVADEIVGAVNVAPADPDLRGARQELFDILLELDRQKLAASLEQGERLHALLGVVALEPHQHVEHQLALGDWLALRARGRAVEAYQTILSTHLSSTPLRRDSTTRTGAAWAARRVAALISEFGPDVYRAQAELAQRRLARLQADPGCGPDHLLSLALEFPFSGAGLDAAVRAAAGYSAMDDPARAVGALASVYRLDPSRARAARLLGWIVEYSRLAGWQEHAAAVLGYVAETFGDLELEGPQGARPARRWAEDGPSRRAPRLGDPTGSADSLPGAVVVGRWPATVLPPDRLLLQDGQELRLFSAARLHGGLPEWTWTLDEPPGNASVLRFDQRQVLLWIESPDEPPRAVMLDPVVGDADRVVWRSGPLGAPARDLPPIGGERAPGGVSPLICGDSLILVESRGGATALRLDSGGLAWQRPERSVMHEIAIARAHNLGIAVAGWRRAGDRGDPVPAVALLDPRTGQTLHSIRPLGGAEVRWMETGPLGGLVYATSEGVEMIDLVSGEPLWSETSQAMRQTRRVWPAAGQLLVEGPASRPGGPTTLRALRPEEASISEPFDPPAGGELEQAELKDILVEGGRVFARYADRVVHYDRTGAVLGADRITDDDEYEWLFPAGDRLILVSRHKLDPGAVAPGQKPQHVYRLYGLSENCRLLGEADQLPPQAARLQRGTVVDGWVVLSSAARSLAVALPPP